MLEKQIHLTPRQIDFSDSVLLVNRSKRFIIPIPALPSGGEELRKPAGGDNADEAIYSNDDGTVQRGIVFRNATDSGWQGVQGNGEEAIGVNNIDLEQAKALSKFIEETVSDISKIKPEQVHQILDFCRSNLDSVDFFDQTISDVHSGMRFVDLDAAIPSIDNPATFLGYMEVSKDTKHQAVRVEGSFSFDGPILQTYKDGSVIVTDGKYSWGVDKDVCLSGWKLINDFDNEIDITSIESDIPEFRP